MMTTSRRDKALREQGQVSKANNLNSNDSRPDALMQLLYLASGVKDSRINRKAKRGWKRQHGHIILEVFGWIALAILVWISLAITVLFLFRGVL